MKDNSKTQREHPRTSAPLLLRVTRIYVLMFGCFCWGIAVVKFEVFPHTLINDPLQQLSEWWRGPAEGRRLSLLEKLSAEFNDEIHYQGTSKIGDQLDQELRRVRDPRGLLIKSKVKLYYASKRTRGYYIFYVIPRLPGALFGAVVISADGELKHVIKRPHIRGGRRVLGQGGVTERGHLVFNSYQHLYVSDLCGRVHLKVKRQRGKHFGHGRGRGFHHKTSGDGDLIWAWYSNQLHAYRLSDRRRAKKITILDIISANEDLPVFESRLIKSDHHGVLGQWKYQHLTSRHIQLDDISLIDPFHQNDVDVLPERLAHLFPQFSSGDLLLSFRSINLIVVLDPQSLKVKWFHSGVFSRQHDPDWGEHGEIVLYDNRSHSSASRIISIDPGTKKLKTLIDGKRWSFYQFAQGNQDLGSDGSVLFTNNSEAVQIHEGQVDFYFKYTNLKGEALDVGSVKYIDEETYRRWIDSCL